MFDEKKNDDVYIYDSLLIATGSENKKLSLDNNLKNDVYYLRNLEEAKTIKEKVLNKNKITIIGGGFIGLEIASSLSQLQKKVTVIEIGNQLMGRIIPKQIADLVQSTHIDYGNKIILNKQIDKITKINSKTRVQKIIKTINNNKIYQKIKINILFNNTKIICKIIKDKIIKNLIKINKRIILIKAIFKIIHKIIII